VGLVRSFGSKRAVDGVDLALAPGEYFCILGPSGSGKTSVLRMLAGFDRPDQGEIRLSGLRVDPLPPERRDVHTVFQGYALFPHLTVAENVAFGLRLKGVTRQEQAGRVGEALQLVGLDGYGSRRPTHLSGGEQQRVALARAIVGRPKVLLLDEPLAALDRALRIRMQEELRRIQQEVGIAFLHITHDQQEGLRLADRLAVMRDGRFVQVGAPHEVYHRPRTAFVARFLGSANLLDGVWLSGAPPRVRVAGGGVLAVLSPPGGAPPSGTRIRLALRPEGIRWSEGTASPNALSTGTAFPARIRAAHSLGGVEELEVEALGVRLQVHRSASAARPLPEVGQEGWVEWDPMDLVPLEDWVEDSAKDHDPGE
jgi:ABC-type Fe3+/spermidine/putrescine transport system ATPase subunit